MKKIIRKQKKNNSSKKQNPIRIVLMITMILFIGICIGVTTYTLYKINNYEPKIMSVHTINTSVNIVSYGGGLNGDKDALKFGKVPLGASSTRYLIINNSKDSTVQIEITGEIAKFISVDKNNFVLQKDTTETIAFQLEVPDDINTGMYNGIVKITFLKI